MSSNGKRYRDATALLEEEKSYQPEEAIGFIKKTATAKFDETVELHIRTGADPRQADQLVRGVSVLPHGVGKPVRIVVFAEGEAATAAEQAGADHIGDDQLIEKIQGGWAEFDVSIATPDMMGKVGRLGRVLGRKGLMPSPRTGTVVQAEDVVRSIDEAKKGRIEYKLDRNALIHVPIGKAGFEPTQLLENLTAIMDAIVRARPSGIKGDYILSVYLTSTMGPSVNIDVASATALKVE